MRNYITELFDFEKIMSAKVKLNEDRLRLYKDYQKERANIYYKKEILQHKAPFTENKVLHNYRFTNVKRELDKGSRVLIDSVCSRDITLQNKLLNIILYRVFISNYQKIPIFSNKEHLDFENNSKEYLDYLNNVEYKSLKDPYFTSASKTNAKKHIQKHYPHLVDSSYLVKFYLFVKDNKEKYFEAFLKLDENDKHTLEFVNLNLPSLGIFFKYQVFVDLTYCKEYTRTENDIIISGPGCSLGISYLAEDVGGLTDEEFCVWFREFLRNEDDFNPQEFLHFLDTEKQTWDLMPIENSFCEFSKYIRLLENKGGQRKYTHTIETLGDF